MNVGTSRSYSRQPGESTEWEDIQRRLGNMPDAPKPEDEEADDAAAGAGAEQSREEALAQGTLDELDEAEDEFADSRILEEYRQRRLAELRAASKKEEHGELTALARCDFVRNVTEGSHDHWVVVFLFDNAVEDSRRLEPIMRAVAAKHKAVQFYRIRGVDCIEKYPERNIPTLLVYHEGAMQRQVVGMTALGGASASPDTVEWVLSQVGAVETTLTKDPRQIGPGAAGVQDDDGDDDDGGFGRRTGSTFVRYVLD